MGKPKTGYAFVPVLPMRTEPVRFFGDPNEDICVRKGLLTVNLPREKNYALAYRLATMEVDEKNATEVWHKTPIKATGETLNKFLLNLADLAFGWWWQEEGSQNGATPQDMGWKEV